MSAGAAATTRVSPLRVAVASFIGTTVEFYDFLIYGTAAALVFPKLFFPNASPASGILLSFATFGVGFFARPLGGIVFGHFGDRLGRKRMLVYSLVGMGVSTVLIGALASRVDRRYRPTKPGTLAVMGGYVPDDLGRCGI